MTQLFLEAERAQDTDPEAELHRLKELVAGTPAETETAPLPTARLTEIRAIDLEAELRQFRKAWRPLQSWRNLGLARLLCPARRALRKSGWYEFRKQALDFNRRLAVIKQAEGVMRDEGTPTVGVAATLEAERQELLGELERTSETFREYQAIWLEANWPRIQQRMEASARKYWAKYERRLARDRRREARERRHLLAPVIAALERSGGPIVGPSVTQNLSPQVAAIMLARKL
jgi:hypothetical protein